MSSSGRNFTISSLLDSNEDNNRRAAQNTSSQLSPKHLTVGVDNSATIVGSRSPTPDIRAQFMAPAAISQPSFQRPILVHDDNIAKRKPVKAVSEIILVDDGPPAPGLGPPKRRTIKKKSPPAQSTLKSGSSLPMLVPKPSQSASPTPGLSFHSNPIAYKGSATPSTPGPNTSGVNDQIRLFQTSFKLAPTPTPQSKTSINSIINVDDGPEIMSPEKPITSTGNSNGTDNALTGANGTPGATGEASATPAPVKKKRAPRKKKDQTDGPAQKKKKTEEVKKEATPANGTDKGAAKTPEPASASGTVDSASTSATTNPVAEPKVEPITATITSEKNPKQEQVNLPPASIIDLNGNTATAAAEVKKEEPPIIALNIPLLDPTNPKPGQSQVVINVLKLTEDKYGWNVMHPNAKSAIDLMDDMIDDEEDAADEEEEDTVVEKENPEGASSNGPKKKKEEEELTEEQLVRQHEVKMNRKVGKYDYEDPFIDDEELQWEEEITSTKEGFFVYWGPLVDDRLSTAKKAGSKTKK